MSLPITYMSRPSPLFRYAPLYAPDVLGLGLTIWSPLASGVLTGKYGSGAMPEGSRLSSAQFQKRADYTERFGGARIAVAERLRPIARRLKCTMGQLALAWCLNNKHVRRRGGGSGGGTGGREGGSERDE